MEKSPDAFRTISEAAEELDLPQHVLRFWETRFTTIKPLKRGGGRRYYRPEDVLLLKGIRHLLYDQGFTIKGVQRILKEQGPRHVMSIGDGRPFEPASLSALPSPDDLSEDDREPAALDDGESYDEVSFDSGDGASEPHVPNSAAQAPDIIVGAPVPRSSGNPVGLSDDDRQRLERVLKELLDCKRLLDRVREH
ncbi:MerR HTH family regulatory protein [Devosia enhydra]|uniref:MerR HTH family regulatory protein n=1 Tax=Devosia enhydra TaxID=665118 RepID=A0A1K2HTB9_9HYPH|nr:MerR family transcriptional regulator [Devosia enhydra]SFZ81362.1 MerR HTH family regulatory protein [Devosia enhydra]